MNLLARNTCGTSRVQHLWQTIRPSFTTSFAKEVDHLTQNTILTIMGLSRNDLDSLHYEQIFLPLRFGGFGYRSSRQIVHESYVARFASAAYGNRYNVSTMARFLLEDLLSPETSSLPSLQAVSAS